MSFASRFHNGNGVDSAQKSYRACESKREKRQHPKLPREYFDRSVVFDKRYEVASRRRKYCMQG